MDQSMMATKKAAVGQSKRRTDKSGTAKKQPSRSASKSEVFSTSFDYSLDFEQINFRAHPELYRIGRGEQGVLMVEPYKSEILPHWRFRTPEVARESAEAIYQLYLHYKEQDDFVGMDMARKFLQMGYTRARRYANHKGGRKYDADGQEILPRQNDPIKAAAARIFYAKWQTVRDDPDYQAGKKLHRERYENALSTTA
jgi:hypothetical protein